MAKKKTVSLYLAKPITGVFEDLLTEKARVQIAADQVITAEEAGFGEGGKLFIFKGSPKTPKWLPEVSAAFPVTLDIKNNSHSALIIFDKNQRRFALSYSYAHVYLDESKFVSDFGLKVSINFIKDSGVRGVERSNIGIAIRDFAQAASEKDLGSYEIDDALDIIRRISGGGEGDFADAVTGARSLRFSKEIETKEIPETAADALKLYTSKAYKNTKFAIIDILSPVWDTAQIDHLNGELVKSLHAKGDDFELAVPEITPKNVAYFNIKGVGVTGRADISLELYLDNVKDLSALTVEDLKKHSIGAFDDSADRKIDRWSVYNSLIGSLQVAGKRYAFNEGKWYSIDDALKASAESTFDTLNEGADTQFGPFITKALNKKGKKKFGYESEGEFNKRVSENSKYICLDADLIPIKGIPGPGIEACDILDIANRRYIHVKKSSRRSSTLSHLFKQGANAAATIKQNDAFFEDMCKKVEKLSDKTTAGALRAAANQKWKIEFQIADFPRADGSYNIPFFSKLTLRDEARRLGGMGYDVGLKFISMPKPAED